MSGNAADFCPVIPYFGLLWYDIDNAVSIPMDYPLCGKWGTVLSDNIPLEKSFPMPFCANACWLSIPEERFFRCEEPLNIAIMEEYYSSLSKTAGSDIYFVMGFGADGFLVLWLQNDVKCYLVGCFKGKECEIPMSEFMPVRPDMTVQELCLSMKNCKYQKSIGIEKLKNKFDNMMRTYNYRYVVSFGIYKNGWSELSQNEVIPDLCWINESLFDGTFDKLHEDNLVKYHSAAIPEKIALKWNVGKTEYSAYFWMDDEQLFAIFKRFYGVHTATKADFIICIDSQNNKYEICLFRQGLKEPVVLPKSAYQMIVFKNKFEDYRSENYNQPRGAWIW